jgi:hypothetical protein
MRKLITAVLAGAAIASSTFTAAEAQHRRDYWDRGRYDRGDVAGAAIVGGVLGYALGAGTSGYYNRPHYGYSGYGYGYGYAPYYAPRYYAPRVYVAPRYYAPRAYYPRPVRWCVNRWGRRVRC